MRSAAMHTTAHGDAPQKTFFIVHVAWVHSGQLGKKEKILQK